MSNFFKLFGLAALVFGFAFAAQAEDKICKAQCNQTMEPLCQDQCLNLVSLEKHSCKSVDCQLTLFRNLQQCTQTCVNDDLSCSLKCDATPCVGANCQEVAAVVVIKP